MDGAPYLRKIDLNVYQSYSDLLKALEIMFKCTIGKNPLTFTVVDFVIVGHTIAVQNHHVICSLVLNLDNL